MAALFALMLSGCSMSYYQEKMNILDAANKAENAPIIAAMATRYYKLEKQRGMAAMVIALSELGFTIDTQDFTTGFIAGRARTPRPLSHAEFQAMAAIEGPRASELTGLPIEMLGGKHDVIINVFFFERAQDLQVNVRFQLRSVRQIEGLILSSEAPPTAVKFAYPKVWNEFEKTAFVQGKVIYGDAPPK